MSIRLLLGASLVLALAGCRSEERAAPEAPTATPTETAQPARNVPRNVPRAGTTQYQSERLGLRVDFPADLMRIAGRPGPHARLFASEDERLRLTVALRAGQALGPVRDSLRATGRVLEQQGDQREAELLVERGERLHLHRLVERNDSLFVLEFAFPAEQRAEYEPTGRQIAASFPSRAR